jgi:chromate transporter
MIERDSGDAPGSAPPLRASALVEIAALFLRLGATAFGGPAAHVAMMEDEVVRRRRWVTRAEFLDLFGATNLIPGPNSTEMAIHLGQRRAGWAGLVVAGSCFILPAALITLALAWVYVRFGALPAARGLLYGVKPVIIAVVFQALYGLGRTAVKTKLLGVVAAACVITSALGGSELAILFSAGALVVAARGIASLNERKAPPTAGIVGVPVDVPVDVPGDVPGDLPVDLPIGKTLAMVGTAALAPPFGLWPLFLVFLKIGAVLFGSGYVLLAFLRADLVDRLHWMTEAQLIDAIAVGQVTPGPVFTTATFIGYLLGGAPGAAVATAGIFLPAFFFVAVSGPLVPRLRRSPAAGAFLDGVNVASLALMAVVTFRLGRSAVVDVPSGALAALSALLLIRFRVNSVWLVFGGAAVGALILGFY